MTEAGIVLGTAAYMSPEQSRGKPVDKRADIWAFGVVLFEMLTGKRLFSGESVSDILASVLRLEIPWQALPSETPAFVRRLLRRCLERDARQWLQAMGEARIALGSPDDGPSLKAHPGYSRSLASCPGYWPRQRCSPPHGRFGCADLPTRELARSSSST